jgi:hypothetical protein
LDFKIQTIEKLFFYIVAGSYLLIPLGVILFNKKNKGSIPYFLGSYGIVFFAFLLTYNFLPKDKELHKLVQLFYTFLEYSFFAFVFYTNVKSRKFRQLILITSILFFSFLVIYYFKSKHLRLDSVPIGIETILTLIYISYFFYETFKRTTDFYVYNHYCFWISIGILIYLGGSFFFFILINDLTYDEVNTFGNMTYIAEIIKNILFSVAIFIYNKHPLKTNNSKQTVPYLDMI